MSGSYQKNDLVTLTITDMGNNGEGIGKVDGYTLFVKDAVVGDRIAAKIIKSKKHYGYGRLMEILEPSPHRVKPLCPCARQCGGCQLQALDYGEQLRFKENKVREHLTRIGGLLEAPMEPIVGMEYPFRYRNKAQFPVGLDREGRIITGFYAGRTHTIIDNRDCVLGVEQNRDVLDRVLSYMEENGVRPYDERTGNGLVRHILIRCGFATGELMVCLVINGKRIPAADRLIGRLREIPGMTSIMLNSNRERSNVILGSETRLLWGQPYITDYIGDVQFQISPLSFYQVNPRQTIHMYEKALEYAGLTGGETVWDLYCGIGTISLFLARKAGKVCGVEIVPQAVEDARANAARNHIANAEFFCGRAEEILPRKYEREGVRADVIVVDPPRKGCGEALLDTIVKIAPSRVVYVSCDSATLARDVKYLTERGFCVERACPFDNFPEGVHVETVCLLSNRKPDARVKIDVDLEDYYRIKDEQMKNKASE